MTRRTSLVGGITPSTRTTLASLPPPDRSPTTPCDCETFPAIPRSVRPAVPRSVVLLRTAVVGLGLAMLAAQTPHASSSVFAGDDPAANAAAAPSAAQGDKKPKATESAAKQPETNQAASKDSPKSNDNSKNKDSQAAKDGELKFTRIARDESGKPISLDTTISRYTRSGPGQETITVDLIGAVHVGEKSYYDALNDQFTKYDAVLFELVAPPNTKIPKGGGPRSANPVSALQTGMKSVLGLEFQLEQIDYTQPNFVHADMSPDEFSQKMKEKNESFWTMFLKMMNQGMAQQANGGARTDELTMLAALFSKNREIKLKQAMALQMESMDGAIEALEGPDGSTILTERNKKALEVLRRELQAGKKNLGIFYGAAHLPDMHRRLESEFGMKFVEHRWVPAWDLKLPESTRSPRKRSKSKTDEQPNDNQSEKDPEKKPEQEPEKDQEQPEENAGNTRGGKREADPIPNGEPASTGTEIDSSIS